MTRSRRSPEKPAISFCSFLPRSLAARPAGFTLMEFIGVMVLSGFLAAAFGSGILNYTRDFLNARRASRLQGEGHLTMTRMTREISNATRIYSGTTTTLDFDSHHEGTTRRLTLSYDAANRLVNLSGTTPSAWTKTLAGNVQDFQLLYYMTYDGTPRTTATPTCSTPISANIQEYKYRFLNGSGSSHCSPAEDLDKIEIEFYSNWGGVNDFIVRYCDHEFPAVQHAATTPPHWEYESWRPLTYCNQAYIYSVSMGIECYMTVPVDVYGCTPPNTPSSPPTLSSTTLMELAFTLTDSEGANQQFITRIAPQGLK